MCQMKDGLYKVSRMGDDNDMPEERVVKEGQMNLKVVSADGYKLMDSKREEKMNLSS